MRPKLIPGMVLAFSGAIAASGSREATPKNDLSCKVFPLKATLGIDLRFHSGFDVAVPFREIEGAGNNLTIRFHVTPKDHGRPPVAFAQRIDVPPIKMRYGGDVKLRGTFDLGEGTYHIDWQMQDRGGRSCSNSWDVEAALGAKERQIEVALPRDTVRYTREDPFAPEPFIRRRPDESRANVKILVNLEPQNPKATALHPLDTAWLVSIVRSIARNAHIGKLSLTAVNIRAQTVFYRQAYSDRIDFPALGRAVKTSSFGTIESNRLARRHGEAEFLTKVIRDETKDDSHPDALIFVGPKILMESNISQRDLSTMGEIDYPVFLLNYNRA